MNITIRKAEPSDAEAIWKCYTAPQVVRNTLQLPYRSLESVRELLTKSGEGDHILVAAVDGEVVGTIGLHTPSRPRINHRGEIGMMVHDDWQGRGVGKAMMHRFQRAVSAKDVLIGGGRSRCRRACQRVFRSKDSPSHLRVMMAR